MAWCRSIRVSWHAACWLPDEPTMQSIPIRPTPSTPRTPPDGTVRAIAIASGKGGVGKTNLTANLAVALARRGLRVWAIDADLGLANLDVVLGLKPARSVGDVLRGERRLVDVAVDGPEGIKLIPAASGVADLATLGPAQQLALLDQIDALDGALDVLLIDVASGLTSNVLYFAAAASETVIVTTPEPTAITDAYALVKVLATRFGRNTLPVVVNMAAGQVDATLAFERLAGVARQFLPVRLELAGWVPIDEAVPRAVRRKTPFTLAAPSSPAALAVDALAGRLARTHAVAAHGGLQFFFRRALAEGRA
jgi:flagellar biosynthesis protein FlhG